eukprot:g1908.t1
MLVYESISVVLARVRSEFVDRAVSYTVSNADITRHFVLASNTLAWAQTAKRLTLNFAPPDVGVIGKVNITLKLHTTATCDAACQSGAGVESVAFEFEYLDDKTPQLQAYYPSQVMLSEVDTITVNILKFDNAVASDLVVLFNLPGSSSTVVAPGLTRSNSGRITFSTPAVGSVAVAGEGEIVLRWNNGAHTLRAPFTFVQPPTPTLSLPVPAEGPATGGTSIVLVVKNLPVAHGDAGWVRPSDLKCSFSDPSAVLAPTLGEVTKVYYSSRDASKIAVTAPGMVNAGRSELSVYLPAIPTFNAVSKTEDGGDVYFKFQAANDAIVESFQPVAGYASGGMTVKATLRNWPSSIAFSSTQEVRATVGAAAQPAVVKSVSTSPADASDPTSSLNSVVEVVMPMISVGARRRLIFGNTQTITLTSELETFSVASFDFRFWPRPVNPPSIVSIVPEQLPLALRQIMRMRIANIGQINHAQDLDVTVGGRKATVVDFNMFNGYSVVYARSPILDQTGSVTVVVSNVNAPDTAEFSVDVFDPYKPEVIFASPTAGSAAGGTLLSEFRPADLSDIRVEVGGVTLDSTAVGAQALTGRSNTYQLKFGCPSLGTERKDANIIVTTPSNSAILARTLFEYTPPTDPRIVLQIPQAGGQLGGDRVSFTIINTDLALAQSARIYFGSAAATSLSASMDAASTARAVLTCTAPAQQQAGDASGVVMLNNFNLTFQFHFIAPPEPSVESILPATVASTGGEEVTLVVRSLPVFASASELVVKMGNSYASVSAATVTEDDEDLHEIIATSPAIAPGTATVEVFVSSFSYLKAVGTIDVINAAVPNVDGLPKPSSGPTTGGTVVYVAVKAFPVVESASDVGFACDGKDGSVESLLDSTEEQLRVQLRTPVATQAGAVTCSVFPAADPTNMASFDFQYQKPLALRIASLVPRAQQILVQFGTQVQVAAHSVFSSNEKETIFFVKAAAVASPGQVSVSVSHVSDMSRVASRMLVYKARPKPRIFSLMPARAARDGKDENGNATTARISVRNFPVVTETSSLLVAFGDVQATVQEIVQSTEDATTVVELVPAAASAGKVVVSVSHRVDVALGSGTAKFTYLGTDPKLQYVFPRKVTVEGGKRLKIALENVRRTRDYSTSEVTVSLSGRPCTVQSVSGTSGQVMSIVVLTPDSGLVAGAASGVVQLDGFADTAFGVTLLAASAPSIKFIFPTSAANLGNTKVTVLVSNFPKGVTAQQLFVRFGSAVGTVTSVRQVGSGDYPETIVVMRAPPSTRSSVTLSVETLDGTKKATAPFKYFAPCNFDEFCPLKGGKETDNEELIRNPPADTKCSMKYCMDPPPLPIVSAVVPATDITNFGGEPMSVTIQNFPVVSAASDVRASFGTVTGIVRAVKLSTATSTTLELVTPAMTAVGDVKISLAHLTSARRTVATFTATFYAEAVAFPPRE